jgi:hypothetical protein
MVVSAKLRNFISPIMRSRSLVINDLLPVVEYLQTVSNATGIRLPRGGFSSSRLRSADAGYNSAVSSLTLLATTISIVLGSRGTLYIS